MRRLTAALSALCTPERWPRLPTLLQAAALRPWAFPVGTGYIVSGRNEGVKAVAVLAA